MFAILGTTTLGVGMMEVTAAFHKQRPGTVLTHVGSGSSFIGAETVSIGQCGVRVQIYRVGTVSIYQTGVGSSITGKETVRFGQCGVSVKGQER